jgi:hypothetical protein
LGKVGAGRRVPPPANLTSLNNDSSQAKNSSNGSVSQSGPAWGEKGCQNSCGESQPSTTVAASVSTITSGSNSDAQSPDSTSNKSFFPQSHPSNKVWASSKRPTNSAASGGGQHGTSNGPQLFPDEFPSLDGGDVLAPPVKTTASDHGAYGPGPSLRPQLIANWTRGVAGQTSTGSAGPIDSTLTTDNPQPNVGNLVNGHDPSSSQPVNGTNRQYGSNQYRQPGHPNDSMSGQSQHGSGRSYPPRYNNSYHSGQHGHEDRESQRARLRAEALAKSKASILTDNDLKCFDDLIDNDTLEDWTRARNQIDFNAKLNFSDDDDEFAVIAKAPRAYVNDDDDEFAEANSNFLRETGRLNSDDDFKRSKQKSEGSEPEVVSSRRNSDERRFVVNKQSASDNVRSIESKNRGPSDYEYSNNKPHLDRDSDKRDVARSQFNRDPNGFSNNGKQFQQKVLPPRFQRLQQQNTFVRPDNRPNADNLNPRKRLESDNSNEPSDAQPQRRILTRDPNWRRNDHDNDRSENKSLNEQFANKISLTSSGDASASAINSAPTAAAKSESDDNISPSKEDQSIGLFDRSLDWASECSSNVEPNVDTTKASPTVHAAPIQISSKQFEFVADSIQNKSQSDAKLGNKNEPTDASLQSNSSQNATSGEPKTSPQSTMNPITEDRRIRRDYSKRDEHLRSDRIVNYESKVNVHHDSSNRPDNRPKRNDVSSIDHSNLTDNSSDLIGTFHSQPRHHSSNANNANQSNYNSMQRHPQRDQRRFERPAPNMQSGGNRPNAVMNSMMENSAGNMTSNSINANQLEVGEQSKLANKHTSSTAPTNSAAANLSSLSTEFNESAIERPNGVNNSNQMSNRNLPRTYGPPPSKAAFGEQLRTHSVRKNSESSDNGGKHQSLDAIGSASINSSGQSSFSAISVDQQYRSDKDQSRRNSSNSNNNGNRNNRRQNSDSYDDNMRAPNNRNRYSDRIESSGNPHSFGNDLNRNKDDRKQRSKDSGKDMKIKSNGPPPSQGRRLTGAEPPMNDKLSPNEFNDYKNQQRKSQSTHGNHTVKTTATLDGSKMKQVEVSLSNLNFLGLVYVKLFS